MSLGTVLKTVLSGFLSSSVPVERYSRQYTGHLSDGQAEVDGGGDGDHGGFWRKEVLGPFGNEVLLPTHDPTPQHKVKYDAFGFN